MVKGDPKERLGVTGSMIALIIGMDGSKEL